MKQEFALQTPLTLPLTSLLMVSVIIVIITNGFMTILALFLFFKEKKRKFLLLLLIDITTHYVPGIALSTQHILFEFSHQPLIEEVYHA